jgi:hypothetical protein
LTGVPNPAFPRSSDSVSSGFGIDIGDGGGGGGGDGDDDGTQPTLQVLVAAQKQPADGWLEVHWSAAPAVQAPTGTITTISTMKLRSPTSPDTPYCLDADGGEVGSVVAASICFPSAAPARNSRATPAQKSSAAPAHNTDRNQQWVVGGDSTIKPAHNATLCLTAPATSPGAATLQPCMHEVVEQRWSYHGPNAPGNNNEGVIMYGDYDNFLGIPQPHKVGGTPRQPHPQQQQQAQTQLQANKQQASTTQPLLQGEISEWFQSKVQSHLQRTVQWRISKESRLQVSVETEVQPASGWRDTTWTASPEEIVVPIGAITTISTVLLRSPTSPDTPYCLDADGGEVGSVVAASICFPSANPSRNTDQDQQWIVSSDATIRFAHNTSMCLTALTVPTALLPGVASATLQQCQPEALEQRWSYHDQNVIEGCPDDGCLEFGKNSNFLGTPVRV